MLREMTKAQGRINSAARSYILTSIAIVLLTFQVHASTTGKLAGRILDINNQPVIGVNILLMDTFIGAATDNDGYFVIINIPPGMYDVRMSSIGYQTILIREVRVNANQTTTLNETMSEDIIEIDEVVIVAERPLVDVRQTSSVSILGRDDISLLPVQELNDIVNLQAGVIDGHFRGGRIGEVQYQVDGVTVNNPFDNSSTLRLDRSILEEVQVISGTFDAEFGQAMSGVVNAILRSGAENYLEWSAEAYLGEFVTPGATDDFPYIDNLTPTTIQNYQLSLSGPLPVPKTTFIFSGRRYFNDSYFFGERRFVPTDSSDFEQRIFNASGDGATVSMGYFDEWSGQAKVTNRSINGVQIGYQAIANSVESKGYNHAFRLIPDGIKTQKRFSIVHGLDFTHALSNSMYYQLNLRHNYFSYTDFIYEDVFDPRYLEAGSPQGDANYEDGAIVQGVDLGRFKQQTNSYVAKGSVTMQVTNFHLVKLGGEIQTSEIVFGSPGVLVPTTVDGVQVLLPWIDHPDYPGIQKYYPVSFAAYAQDRMEWHDLTIRAGVRFEYFDAKATIPSDIQNPANSIEGAPQSAPQKTSNKAALAPRLGVSYPIAERASVYFSYGHFYQMPGLGDLYSNSDYSILDELQAGGISYGVLGNPDLKPEFTTQYEFGFKAEVTGFLGVDLSLFNKDIRDLLGVEFVSTYAAAEYARLTNVDFGNVSGFTLSLQHRSLGLINASLDYTFQVAQGNASDPRETANRAAAGEDPRPRQVPLNWDQRHTLNTAIVLQKPGNFNITSIIKYNHGMPFTPSLGSGFGASIETNSGKKPVSAIIDIRAEKYFKIGSYDVSLFARVFNLFDARFANGFVFNDTGSPFYTLNPVGNRVQLTNPARFTEPRRIEIGITLRNLKRLN